MPTASRKRKRARSGRRRRGGKRSIRSSRGRIATAGFASSGRSAPILSQKSLGAVEDIATSSRPQRAGSRPLPCDWNGARAELWRGQNLATLAQNTGGRAIQQARSGGIGGIAVAARRPAVDYACTPAPLISKPPAGPWLSWRVERFPKPKVGSSSLPGTVKINDLRRETFSICSFCLRLAYPPLQRRGQNVLRCLRLPGAVQLAAVVVVVSRRIVRAAVVVRAVIAVAVPAMMMVAVVRASRQRGRRGGRQREQDQRDLCFADHGVGLQVGEFPPLMG